VVAEDPAVWEAAVDVETVKVLLPWMMMSLCCLLWLIDCLWLSCSQ
jgi:hypothetical protein